MSYAAGIGLPPASIGITIDKMNIEIARYMDLVHDRVWVPDFMPPSTEFQWKCNGRELGDTTNPLNNVAHGSKHLWFAENIEWLWPAVKKVKEELEALRDSVRNTYKWWELHEQCEKLKNALFSMDMGVLHIATYDAIVFLQNYSK